MLRILFRIFTSEYVGILFVMHFGFRNFKPKKIKAGSIEDPDFTFSQFIYCLVICRHILLTLLR